MDDIKNEVNSVLWDAKTTAKYMGISYWSLTELARKRKIPCTHVGDRSFFRKEVIDQWILDQEKESVKPETNRFGVKKIM